MKPLEGSRVNPFLAPGVAAIEGEEAAEPKLAYSYGTNWHLLPITARLGFVRPNVPARAAVAPPPASEEPSFDITITSILWTQDGQAMAVYESGGKSGVVRPGDIVGDWVVAEIWRDRVVVADRKTNRQQTVYMTTKKPTPPRPAGGGTRPPTTGGRTRPARPGGAPAGGMPPPVR
jgi:hypothetical protein